MNLQNSANKLKSSSTKDIYAVMCNQTLMLAACYYRCRSSLQLLKLQTTSTDLRRVQNSEGYTATLPFQ